MTISATAKSKISIGTTAAASNLTEFEADTYTEIGEVEDLGEWGAEAAELVFHAIPDDWVRRRKGSRDAGVVELVCARDPADAGQMAVRAAMADSLAYNFKVELNDKPNATGTNTFFYFRAVVLSDRNNLGQADNIVRTTFRLGIDGEIFEDPAVAGV